MANHYTLIRKKKKIKLIYENNINGEYEMKHYFIRMME